MLCFGREVFMADKRRQFTREFKLEAIRLIIEEKKPVAEVARQLGIRHDMLRAWRRQLEGRAGLSAEETFPGHGNSAAPEEEVRRLRREVERLRQERDFLKKAAAYFAKE
jgi:transposase